jgi:hypothetical protein
LADEKSSGKWAGEAFDFFHLFGKINKSIYGLLLIEIGWVFLLLMISKLSPAGDNPAPAKILFPGGEILVIQLLVPGVIILLIMWCFWSGIYFYLWVPIGYSTTLIVGLLAIPFSLLVAGINAFPIFPVAYLIRRRHISEYIAKLNNKQINAIETSFYDIVTKKIYNLREENNKRGIEKIIGKKAAQLLKKAKDGISDEERAFLSGKILRASLYEYVNDEVKDDPWFLSRWVMRQLNRWFTSISSQVNIGLAPIHGISYEESRSSTKMTAQTYSAAVGRIRSRLKNVDAIHYIKFHILPEHISPLDAIQAERMKNWLNFDVLLWGSYMAGSDEKIWINSNSTLARNQENYEKEDKENDFPDPKIFLSKIEIEPFTLVIDQNKLWDMYIILVYSIIMAVKDKSSGSTFRAYRYERKADQIIAELLNDAFLKLPTAKVEDDFFSSPDGLLANLAGEWIGYKIGDATIDDKDVEYLFENKQKFYKLILLCIDRLPLIHENYYRAGAMASICGEVEEAIQLFLRAIPIDSIITTRRLQIAVRVRIDTEIMFLKNSYLDREELLFARLAGYTAFAINLGDPDVKKEIYEKLEKETFYKIRDNCDEYTEQRLDESPSLRTLQILLSDAYSQNNTIGSMKVTENSPQGE